MTAWFGAEKLDVQNIYLENLISKILKQSCVYGFILKIDLEG
jgi:hypothetical protein